MLLLHRGLALDERHRVVDESAEDIVSFFADPLVWNVLLIICYIREREQLGVALVCSKVLIVDIIAARFASLALESDHLVCLALEHRLDCSFTCGE